MGQITARSHPITPWVQQYNRVVRATFATQKPIFTSCQESGFHYVNKHQTLGWNFPLHLSLTSYPRVGFCLPSFLFFLFLPHILQQIKT